MIGNRRLTQSGGLEGHPAGTRARQETYFLARAGDCVASIGEKVIIRERPGALWASLPNNHRVNRVTEGQNPWFAYALSSAAIAFKVLSI